MIYFILILFFTSLFSIIFMVGKKLILLKNGQIEVAEGALFEIPYLKELKHLIAQSIKKYEHEGLVLVVKFYLQGINLAKVGYGNLKKKIKDLHIKKQPNGEVSERVEVSKFLRFVSTYKHKIIEIKHRIKEEEKNP